MKTIISLCLLLSIFVSSCTKQPIISNTSLTPLEVKKDKSIRGGRAIANIRLQGRKLQDYQAIHFDIFLGTEYTYLADVNNSFTLKFNKNGDLTGTASINERSADVASYIWSNLTPEATESYYPYNEIQYTYMYQDDNTDILMIQYEEILRGRRVAINNGR